MAESAGAQKMLDTDPDPLPGPATSWAPGEAAPRVEAGGANLDDMVKPPKDLQDQLVGQATQKATASDAIYKQMAHTTDEDSTRLREAYKNEGIKPGEFKKWDADEEAVKRRTDPIEAFASFGSVFGILASAFTHAPMENALNASAAAINSIKAGDQKSYDQANEAWQKNTKMALERHQLEHQAFQDADAILKTNMAAGMQMAQLNAMRFDDKKSQYLLEHGMIKEWYEYQGAKQKAALGLAEMQPKIAESNAQMSDWMELKKNTKPFTPERDEAVRHLNEVWGKKNERTPQQDAYAKFSSELNEDGTPKSAAQRAEFLNSLTYGKGGLTEGRQRATLVSQRAKENEASGMSPADALEKATVDVDSKIAEAKKAGLTGNKKDELTGKVNRVEYMESTIDKVEQLLKKHKAITGLGGSITRPGEVVSNIFGGNETDRKQFERYILELQEWAPQALNDRQGRPLSSEAGKINGIIAGLRPGDTTANTARAYYELRGLLKKIKGNLEQRRGGAGEKPPVVEKPAGNQSPWERDPEVK